MMTEQQNFTPLSFLGVEDGREDMAIDMSNIGPITFLFLLKRLAYRKDWDSKKKLLQDITCSPAEVREEKLFSLIDGLDDCPEVLKDIFRKYAVLPEGLTQEDLQSLNITSLLFQTAYIHRNYDDSLTSCDENFLNHALSLLDLEKTDRFAFFFGNPDDIEIFFATHQDNLNQIPIEKPDSITIFEPKVENYVLQQLNANDFGHSPDCLHMNLLSTSPEMSFRKILAFPPIFKKITNTRQVSYLRNEINIEHGLNDSTELYIQRVIDSLDEEGIAVICVSDAFFSRNHYEFHKMLIEQKLLTGIIYIPLGWIRPSNIYASLLVINKSLPNVGVHYMDVRSESISSQEETDLTGDPCTNCFLDWTPFVLSTFISQSEQRKTERIRNQYKEFIPYAELAADEYKLYFSPVRQRTFEESENPSRQEFFTLKEEAELFKGLQDMSCIELYEKTPADGKDLIRYLRITDIEENRIREDSMQYARIIDSRRTAKFILSENDIVISKFITPIKVAIAKENIIPVSNLYVIRLRPESKLTAGYLKGFIESEEGIRQLNAMASGGSIRNIQISKLGGLQIPRLSVEAQQVYVQQYRTYEQKLLDLEEQIKEIKRQRRELIYIDVSPIGTM